MDMSLAHAANTTEIAAINAERVAIVRNAVSLSAM
jgi:hypothetical protein